MAPQIAAKLALGGGAGGGGEVRLYRGDALAQLQHELPLVLGLNLNDLPAQRTGRDDEALRGSAGPSRRPGGPVRAAR